MDEGDVQWTAAAIKSSPSPSPLISTSNSITCDEIWDGIDFTQCFTDRYIRNLPFLLIVISLIYLLVQHLLFRKRKRESKAITPKTLISPTSDSDLSNLESVVILDTVASNLLPTYPSTTTSTTGKLGSGEAENVIKQFKESEPPSVTRWRRIKFWIGLLGGIVWFEVELARAVVAGDWRNVALPAWAVFLSLLPGAPLTPLLSCHILPNILSLRSAIITHDRSTLRIVAHVVELAFWVALISIPYSERLDRLLDGAVSHGGGSLGSYGEKLKKHYEEPTSPFSRATYTFLLPLLFKHYYTPITLKDIPAIREDDSAASSLGAFRAYQAKRDEIYAKKHKAKRNRHLGRDLLKFFAPELVTQTAWAILFICFQYLPPTGLRLLLQYVKDREASQQPAHVAVLYVGMMVAGQVIGVVAMGQSLFIGRRLCIRLRAIIISDVFTKALRRRDLSGHIKKATIGKDGKVVETESEAATEGKIANLVSVDAFTISEICAYIYYLVSCPVAILINSILLYRTLGLAAFAGIAMTVALFPVQGYIARLYTLYQRRFMAATDARLENVTEVISHIKLIKFNAWETKFFERMGESRRKELSVLAHRFAMTTLFQVVVWGTPVLVTSVAFAVHSMVLHEPLTADRAFASLILFNMLKDPLALFQDTLTRLLQAWTSCTRIQSYLDEPDTLKYRQLSVPGPDDPQIGFKGAVLGYALPEDAKDEEGDPFILGELDLSFPVGQLSIVCGPVGCGKSTLVLGLLGETMLLSGKVYMPDDHANREVCPIDPCTGLSDTIAYCSQTPWLVGASIRENIVFGSEWNKTRYNRIVDACALRRDFEIFELGDETEVGEKGTTCSGGQKARIALARAFYSSAKTIILDDVLSAVDAQTARHLYNHILQGPLVKGRTVVMVTHQVHLVAPAASYVVMLEDGHVKANGSPSQLKAAGHLDHIDDDSNSGSTTPTAIGSSSSNSHDNEVAKDIIEDQLDGSEGDALEVQKQVEADKAAETTNEVKLSKQLVAAEQSGTGMVGLNTYLLYFKSMGQSGFWLLVLTAFFGSQFLQVASNAWIKEWANSNSPIKDDKPQRQERSTMFYLVVYWGISACYLVAVAARVGITFFGAIGASKSLYDRLAKRILGAKMRFFDSTPSGRIMNRLSKDMSSIDQEAGEILMYFANCILSVIAVLAVVVLSTPVFIFTLIIIAILYWIIGSLYVTTNREIKRIDSVTRSPIFISFSEVLVGMSTIRSYGDSARFTRKLLHELDQNTRCFWYLWQINRVLNNFSNFVGALVTIFAAVFALRNKDMDAGAVGLSVTYALSFTEYVLWVVRLYAASEMSMNSVERVGEYLELEVEEEETKKGIEPPAYWPTRDGSVVVENLTARYAPQLEPVLRDVSFTIGPKEKIGICGRTGSGKSTLALSFFRFLHQDGGSITIDGLDISKLSLTALRSRLTILPQEAQLFSGSVRDNLDPFDQHEDAEIWDALSLCGLVAKSRRPSRVQSRVDLSALSPSPASSPLSTPGASPMKAKYNRNLGVDPQGDSEPSTPVKKVHKLPSMRSLQKKLAAKNKGVGEEGGVGDGEEDDEEEEERVMIKSLEEKVAVGGKNFSQGQRQLLALARGLLKLKTSSFLIMDESTANLDHETDKTIQNVLRNGLKDIQMLVIAHRLMTVCGLDKILVLDHGRVVEFGTPYDLLQKESGSFKDLCKQSGEESQLLELAKNVHEAKMAVAHGDQE